MNPGISLAGTILLCCLVSAIPFRTADAATAKESRNEEWLRLGERMYREGILPSGEPMRAIVQGDIPVESTAFSCVSCHLRSGIGSLEGWIYTPPINGAKLYQPLNFTYKGTAQDPKYFPVTTIRSAYTDATLAEAIQGGIDPDGRVMNEAMPRYLLDKQETEIMVNYLKQLSSRFSPGVTDTSIRFATIIVQGVPREDIMAMTVPLDQYFLIKNSQVKAVKEQPKIRHMVEKMLESKELAHRTLTLSRWVLKGPPDTWRAQLETYYRKEPVFALLGGVTTGEWAPIHRFCEDNQIPCLFPNTDYPVLSDTDWYTVYLSKGYFQEGEAAARYLSSFGTGKPGKIIQVARDSRQGKALSQGFQTTCRDLGLDEPATITLKMGEPLSGQRLQQIMERDKPSALVLWDGPEVLRALKELAASKPDAAPVFISATYLGKRLNDLSAAARDFTYITYPHRMPGDVPKLPMGGGLKIAENRIENHTFILTQVFTMALMNMKGNYYRDALLDVIGMLMDLEMPMYERVSFGPGQRYASKGCYIVQLPRDGGTMPIKKSPWVIH